MKNKFWVQIRCIYKLEKEKGVFHFSMNIAKVG